MASGAVTIEAVYSRLASLGYSIVPEDTSTIRYLIDKTVNAIKLDTNYIDFPVELLQMAIDMVCGEFLQTKYALGQLTGYDFSGSVKKITEGDTTVEYAYGTGSKTPEERFLALIKQLRTPDKSQIAAVRRLRW
ncbi:MAG: hypothetical protein IKU98_00195 [Bacteroidaceae bacterium]|nr:hypothetical protein [Bacteroidaceae bacterium]